MTVKKEQTKIIGSNLTRREVLAKTGKYAAYTAIASLLILSPKKSQADSPPDPGWGK